MPVETRFNWIVLGEGEYGRQWFWISLYRKRKEADQAISRHVKNMIKEYGRNWRDNGYPKFKAVRVRVDLSYPYSVDT